MKSVTKRTLLSLLLVVALVIGMMPQSAYASTFVSQANLTADIDSVFYVGGTITSPTVTPAEGSQFIVANSNWTKKVGEDYVSQTGSFTPGTWRLTVTIMIAPPTNKDYVLAENMLFKVNNMAYTKLSYAYTANYSTYTACKEFTLADVSEFTFVDSSSLDIPVNYVGKAIDSVDVSNNVVGGTAPYTIAKVSGPDWISVSSDGIITGTPVVTGENEDLVVSASDSNGASASITIAVGDTIVDPANRTKVTSVVATSNIDSFLNVNDKISDPIFTISEGVSARFETDSTTGWYYGTGSNRQKPEWTEFASGTWLYHGLLVIDGDAGHDYVLSSDLTVTVDGRSYNVLIGTLNVTDTSSSVYVNSPDFTIAAAGELVFNDSDDFDIPANTVGEAIATVTLSGAVSGGAEPYTFSKFSGPDWITVSSDGVVSGTPVTAGDNSDLVVRVSDDKGESRDITIAVGATSAAAVKTMISRIDVISSINDVVGYGNDIVCPTFSFAPGSPVSLIPYSTDGDCLWLLTDDTTTHYDGLFTAGNWKCFAYFGISAEDYASYDFADNVTVTVDEQEWTVQSFLHDGTRPYLLVVSPAFTVEENVPDEYTVTFNTNGGSEIDSATVVSGGFVSKPEDPTKDNCTFEGWFADEELKTPFDFSQPIAADTNVYAKWSENTPARLKGDINNDGKVDNKDLLIMRKNIADNIKNPLEGDDFNAADMNNDGNIDNKDLIKIRRDIAAS